MFHSRKVNSKTNHIHERTLTLKKDKLFCIDHKNIRSLAIELFKVKNCLANRIMCDIFETRNLNYNLRSQTDFIRTRANTSSFELNSLSYLPIEKWDSSLRC